MISHMTYTDAATRYLDDLAAQIGAAHAVVASADGLLVAGTSHERDTLETLAAYAPSQLPTRVERPAGLSSRRVEVDGHRLYVATVGAPPPAEAADALALILAR